MSALCQKQTFAGLLDHLVGGVEQCCRDCQIERLCSLEIDDKFVPGGSLNWEITRFLASQNAIDVCCRPSPLIDLIGPVGHEPALGCQIPEWINCRQAMVCRQCDDRLAVGNGERIRRDDQTAIRLTGKLGKFALDADTVIEIDRSEFDPEVRCDQFR